MMDDFFDVDKALDDLEESEDKEQQYPQFTSNGTGAAIQGPSAPFEYANGFYAPERDNNVDYKPPINLDMDEADFAPSMTLTSNKSTHQANSYHLSKVQNGIDSLNHDFVDDSSLPQEVNKSDHLDSFDKLPTPKADLLENEPNPDNIICDKVDSEPESRVMNIQQDDVVDPSANHQSENSDQSETRIATTMDFDVECSAKLIPDTDLNHEETANYPSIDEPDTAIDFCTNTNGNSDSAPDKNFNISNVSETIASATNQLEESMTSDQVPDTPMPQNQSISLTNSTIEDTLPESMEETISEAVSIDTVPVVCESSTDAKGNDSVMIETDSPSIDNSLAHDISDASITMASDATTLPNNDSSTGILHSEEGVTLKTDDDLQVDRGANTIVGFEDCVDLDISNDEMEQYLSTIGGPDNYTEYDSKPSFADEMRTAIIPDNLNISHDAPEDENVKMEMSNDPVVTENSEERRDSDGSVEKFLAPMVMSPGITTPIEDPGYSKVPGYMPEASATIEEEDEGEDEVETSEQIAEPENIDEECEKSESTSPNPHQGLLRIHNVDSAPISPDLGGARPKEPSGRISRPNSLLGLSTPDLPTLVTPAQPMVAMELPTVAKAQPMVAVAQTPSVPHPGVFANVAARDSGIVADSGGESENSSPNDALNTRNIHDLINTQLATQKSLPLMKKQMNLEIKQHLDQEYHTDNKYSSEINDHELIVQDNDQIVAQRPTMLGSVIPSPIDQSGSLDPQAALPASSPRQKRPSSLNIVQLSTEQLNQDVTPSSDSDTQPASSMGTLATGEIAVVAPESQENMEEISLQPEIGTNGSHPSMDTVPLSPPTSANINLAITQLGKVAPIWIPDAEAPVCMQCEARFTFTKRRHHCRACGKVFCNGCCNLRSRLVYMENKEARVCSKCYQDLIRAQVYERMHQSGPSPNPNNPSEYCSTVPPLQQAAGALNTPPPTVMVPSGVLRKDGNNRRSVEGPKQVMFSDGIRPGGDLTELDGGSEGRIPSQKHTRRVRRMDKGEDKNASAHGHVTREQHKTVCLIPDEGLPPVLLSTGVKGDFSIEVNPDPEQILPRIRSTDDPEPVVFAINKNLFVIVKILTLDCCVNRVCWSFTTKGMCTVAQDEIVIVLECLPDEKTVPRDIFCHLHAVYEEASKGNTVSHLGHTIFAQGFLDCRDHSGFLYINASYQCLQKLILPPQPFIFGILLQRWETPWAKVFPIRLMLRLGAEFRYYPCPLISVRFRKPVFGEIGHTIMNLLADFRNYQYMLPQVPGVYIHMEDKQTYINLPRNRYNNIMKVLSNSNDHVMALGANFSLKADSHLVCIQNEDASYQTQAINIQNKPRKVTGASFVVFNGAFKQTGGLRAKSSIVEDGLMVQITAEMMVQLKEAMRNMLDHSIGCGGLDAPTSDESVTVQWVDDDTYVNIGVKSPVDNMAMDGKESIRIHTATDFVGEKHTIRWTECFFIQNHTDSNSRCEPVDLSRLAETLAQATCIALTQHLTKLQEAHLTKIALRATIDPDRTCYEVGSNGSRLPDQYMDSLDNALIPIIHNAATHNQDGPAILELIFHVIE